jgi:mercuric ion transport protein
MGALGNELGEAAIMQGAAATAGVRHRQMTDKSLLKIGVVGTLVTAICCFTPLLLVLLGAIGLSSLIGLLDLVLLPALTIFLLLTGYGLWKRRRKA